MSKIQLQAAAFVSKCREWGWSWEARGQIITVCRKFAAGSCEEFTQAEGEAYSLLDMCPLSGGSVWGTDGGGIGGAVAMQSGFFKLNKSGETGRRFVAAVAKCR